jgi:hypothetical protein
VSEKRVHEWSPPFSPHVVGWYEERTIDPETGIPEPSKVWGECRHAECMKGGEPVRFQTVCSSGLFRQHIATFGRVHLHRDPLNDKPPPPPTPGITG